MYVRTYMSEHCDEVSVEVNCFVQWQEHTLTDLERFVRQLRWYQHVTDLQKNRIVFHTSHRASTQRKYMRTNQARIQIKTFQRYLLSFLPHYKSQNQKALQFLHWYADWYPCCKLRLSKLIATKKKSPAEPGSQYRSTLTYITHVHN